MSSLVELEGQIGQALRPDQHRFRKQLRAIREASRAGKPFDKNLARLTEEIVQSVAAREARRSGIPAIRYDDSLPVSARREEIAQAIRDHQVIVVCGETGSGKSTQLPKICLELGRGVDGLIGHTQPRRIAARSIATRVAEELGSPVGGAVGFKIRFTDETGPQTYIKLMTDGILLAESQRDKFLNQYDTIIIDEAHERSLNIDFLIGYLKRLLPKRPDLKVILTSATIDAERFAEHFATTRGPAPVVMVSGRTYPVEVRYRPPADGDGTEDEEPDWDQAIVAALQEVAEIDDGDVLVFLPTERDIHDMAKLLRGVPFPGDRPGKKTEVLPLYARLPTSEQNRVFARHPHRRIVLATNVAESSLTVPGIRYVIDPGTARISRYSARSKMLRLPIEPISQASADQRKGRCGRVGPGICVRLYSEQDFETRERFTAPEVQRTSLASVILQLKSLEFGEIEEFPFLDPPKTEAIRDGYKTLFELGALDEAQNLTPLGRRLSRIPLDPRVARIVLAGDDETCLSEVLIIAAVLELQDPRERPLDKQQAADECHARFLSEESDFLSYLSLWDFYDGLKHSLKRSQLRKACHQNFLSYNRMQEWLDVHRQLLDMVSELDLRPRPRKNDPQAIHRALLTGLLSNVAMKGEAGGEYTVGGGSKVFLWPGSGLLQNKPKWVVAAEQIETTKRYLRTVGKIDPGWIERLAAHLVKRSYSDPAWDPDRACVRAFEKVSLSGLPVVARRPVNYGPIEPVFSRELFIRHALVQGEFVTPGKFRERNAQLIEELSALEKKARQPGLLRDDEARYEFFDKRIPPHVFDGARFEKWRKSVEWEQPDILVMTREDLLVSDAPTVALSDFPDAVSVQHLQLPLEYRFAPGEATDGVTLTVPMQGLNQLDPRRLGWLVPGLLAEKVTAMIKSLPKPVRRLLVPANETSQRVVRELKFGVGDFATEVAAILSRLSREHITPDLFNIAQLPPHLQLNIRVVDSAGEELAAGRDLESLRTSLGAEASKSFTQMSADDPRWSRTGITKWDFGDLPLEVTLTRGGLELKGYPALVDAGETVALRLLDSPVRSAAESRRGLRRLFVLSHARELKSQVTNLPGIDDRRTLGATLEWERTLKQQLVELLADRALTRDGEGSARPTSATEWGVLAQKAAGRIGLAVQDITELVGPLLAAQQESKTAIDRLGVAPPLQPALRDTRQQWKELTKPGYLTTTPWPWLMQLPRYYRGIKVRLTKLLQGGLVRDQKGCERLAPFLRAYAQRLEQHQNRGVEDPQLALFRWMIEEFRVSVFAQELKTALPVSEKRLEEQWQKVSP